MPEIRCENCGCMYEGRYVPEEETRTVKLVECFMCRSSDTVIEEVDEDIVEDEEYPIDRKMRELEEKANQEIEEENIEYPYKKRSSVFTEEADGVISDNYEDNTDRELVKLIKEELDEEYTYEQVKARRKYLGFFKQRGFKSGNDAGSKKKYTDEHIEWIKENYEKYPSIIKFTKAFNKQFDMNISNGVLSAQLSNRGIKRYGRRGRKRKVENVEAVEIITPAMKHVEKIAKRKRKGMSKVVVDFIQDNYLEKTDEELRESIADKFNCYHDVNKIKAYRETNGMIRPMGWKPDEFGSLDLEDGYAD